MSPIKEFITAVAEVQDEEEGRESGLLEFSVDGVLCTAHRPSDGQLAVLMATTGRHSSQEEQIAGLINFFVAVLDDESHTYIVSKLLDRKDPFGLEQVQDIMEWMTEEWSGRPTNSSSASTGSQKRTGRKSTAAVPAST